MSAVGTHTRCDKSHLGGADGLAELAGDAPLFSARVAPQRVLPAEARAKRSLLERVVDGHLGLDENLFFSFTR